ncbi:MAG: hypothetical protein LM549_13645, partial [Candidatus Competibacter sp.]|nr:hypothetical protein [Candidatus Competibacter sp.]
FFKLDQRGTPAAVAIIPSAGATSKAQSPSQTVQKPDHRRPATANRPIAAKAKPVLRSVLTEKKPVATAAVSDEWEEF